MSSIPHDHAHGHDDAHDHHPTGIMRWITTTNHKDIGTMYLWFSFIMFLIGGVMALTIRAELFQPGLQVVHPEFFNSMTTLHGLIMVFGAIMPARGRLRELDDPDADRRAGHGVRADEQLELLAAAAGRDPADHVAVRSRRRRRRGLDDVPAADHPGRHGHGPDDLRRPHHGRVVDHGLDQHHHDHPQPARAGHDADEDAAVLLDLADHRVPADRRDAGARRRGHDAADRPPLRHVVLQRGRRRRPGAVPARLLVLRAPRGLHHHPAGVRHHLADHPGVLAQAAVRLRVDGLRDRRRSRSCRSSSGRTTCSPSACRRRACCSSCTRRC